METRWTIRSILGWIGEDLGKRGVDNARLDAEVLVAHALGLQRVQLYLELERPLNSEELAQIRSLVQRRRAREPVAYLVGYRDFFGHRFAVDPGVLIPRPDTETLVEHSLATLKGQAEPRVADLCTGSGAVGISIALGCPPARVDLTDVSAEALRVARQNIDALDVADRVHTFEGDLCAALPDHRYDLLVANPPYVPASSRDTLAPEITQFEPAAALFVDGDGAGVLRRILDEAPTHVRPGGHLLLEIGFDQAALVAGHLGSHRAWQQLAVHPDLNGVPRVVHAMRV